MVTPATPVIVLGPTGNLQGTYKFYNLVTGKKIKRRMFMPYPMPNLDIKKVGKFSTGKQDGFDFADHDGTFFEGNNDVNAFKGKGLVKEDAVLCPSITAEFLGVVLMCYITPNPMAALRMLLLAMPILDRSSLQEWMYAQYTPTQTRLMRLAKAMMTT
jgi:hypothetical protein